MRGDRKLAFDEIIVSFAKKIFTNKRTCMTLDHYASLSNVRLGGRVAHKSVFIHPRVMGFSRQFGGHRSVRGTLGRTRTSMRCMRTMRRFSGNSFREFLRRFFLTVRSHCSVRGPLVGEFVHGGLKVVGGLGIRGGQLGSRFRMRHGGLRGCTHRCCLVKGRYVVRTRSSHTTVTGCSGTVRLGPSCAST